LSHLQGEAENRQGDRVTIEPQTFSYLKRNLAKDDEDTAKNPTIT